MQVKDKSEKLPGIFRKPLISDAEKILKVIAINSDKKLLLPRTLNEIFTMLRSFWIYEENGKVLGTAALEISWHNLAEIKAVSIHPDCQGRGIGSKLIQLCLEEAKTLAIPRIFCLTFSPDYFKKLNFEEVAKETFPHKIWNECVKCHLFPDCGETAMEYRGSN